MRSGRCSELRGSPLELQPVLTNRQEWFDLAVRPQVSVPNGTSDLYEEEDHRYGVYS
jgi:hypothetical protein